MKKPRNFEKTFGVLNVGMVFVGFMFIAMGFISYLRYGDDVKSSVTLNLKDSDGMYVFKIMVFKTIELIQHFQFKSLMMSFVFYDLKNHEWERFREKVKNNCTPQI